MWRLASGGGGRCSSALRSPPMVTVSGAGASERDGVYIRQVDDRHPADGAHVPPFSNIAAKRPSTAGMRRKGARSRRRHERTNGRGLLAYVLYQTGFLKITLDFRKPS